MARSNTSRNDVRQGPKQGEIPALFIRPSEVPRAHIRARKTRKVAAPPTFYRMLRRGTFNAHENSANQYVREGHEIYYYTLQIIWSGSIKLDYKDFILDNSELAAFISNMKLQGSGEMMLKAMMEQINVRLIELGIPPLACKITVRGAPEEPRAEAYLEYTQARPEHMALLQ